MPGFTLYVTDTVDLEAPEISSPDKDKDKDIRTLHAHSRLPVAPPAVPRPVCPPDAPYSLTACAPLGPGWALPHRGQSRMAGRGEGKGGGMRTRSTDTRRLATPLMRDTPQPQQGHIWRCRGQCRSAVLYAPEHTHAPATTRMLARPMRT